MPNLTVSVPLNAVPDLVSIGKERLEALGIDTKGMTNLQVGQRMIAEILKVELVVYRRRKAEEARHDIIAQAASDAAATVDAAVSDAVATADGISG